MSRGVKQVVVASLPEPRSGQGLEPTAFFDEDGNPVNFGGESGPVAWGDVTGKPATFPPATHNHTVAQVTGLQAIINDLTARIEALESA